MGMTIAEALEVVGRALQQQRGDQPITRTEIVARVAAMCGCDQSSVLPSDYCYNRTNDGVRLSHVPMFLHVGGQRSGRYRFVGRDYPYTGPVDHYPQGGQSRQVETRLED